MSNDLKTTTDKVTGWTIIHARIGDLAIALVPAAGCNVASIQFQGQELLRQAPSLSPLRGFRYGVPVLYPTPGRVADGRFVHEGKTYTFPSDEELGVLHGLACQFAWKLKETIARDNESVIDCELEFCPDTDHFDTFPLPHTLELRVTLTANALRWEYRVQNDSASSVPFGFGLHPWFLYQGTRESTWLLIDTNEKEVLHDGLAVGQREPVPSSRFPLCLADVAMDDVFCLSPETAAIIEFRAANLMLKLTASEEFRWLVAYTPRDEPWFCVENWTSIPDAHNLFAAGHQQTGLRVLRPGEACQGWIELQVGGIV